MATITPVAATSDSTISFASATSGGDTIAGATSQRIMFLVNNGSGSSINVTFAATNPCNQGVLHNLVTACGAGVITEIAVPANCISTAAGSVGNVGVTYSAVTTVTVAATTS